MSLASQWLYVLNFDGAQEETATHRVLDVSFTLAMERL